MSRIGLGLLLILTLLAAGCGYGSKYNSGMNAPNVTNLTPNMKTAGADTFAMTVAGSGFGMDSVVFFNGNALPTRYSSGTSVTAQVAPTDVLNAGQIPVFVKTGGKSSNVIDFTVQ